MYRPVIMLSIPGLRPADLPEMPVLSELAAAGRQGCLSLDGNILLLVDGDVILIEAGDAQK